MLDFVKICMRPLRSGGIEFYPKFLVKKSKDLMIKGGKFFAIYDEAKTLWSTEEDDVRRLIDELVLAESKLYSGRTEEAIHVALLEDNSTKLWKEWKSYSTSLSDNFVDLNGSVIFSNQETKREDYATTVLPYALEEGEYPCWSELTETLYDPEELEKIEWAIGSIISGDSKKIQKFLVFKGPPGSGKSTILDIINGMFAPYTATFDAKALGNSNKEFSLESFRNNPLIAIQQDGDLSKIEDNTKINSLVSHESMEVNEKFKNHYTMKFRAFLMMGTNEDVMINSANSGITRRLIDVYPSERHVEFNKYNKLISGVKFEYGAIAYHCLQLYLERGKSYYNSYRPKKMIRATNEFFNFIEDNLDLFLGEKYICLKTAWTRYNEYVVEARVLYPFPRRKFKAELLQYFEEFHDRYEVGDSIYSSVYVGFKKEKFGFTEDHKTLELVEKPKYSLETLGLGIVKSAFDAVAINWLAQLANAEGTPTYKWDNVKTTLKDIDSHKLHYVRIADPHHIVIDFDIKDENGNKCLEKNIEAASKFPKTYTELSKSGSGIHLHYIYSGDPEQLSFLYDENIEIKVFKGKSALRRKLTMCNEEAIATINSGLPLKGEGGKKLVDNYIFSNERAIRTFIRRAIAKEYCSGTKPSVEFIKSKLDEMYDSDVSYDVSNLYQSVMMFAMGSTNHSKYCCDLVDKMHFQSKDVIDKDAKESRPELYSGEKLDFFDIEVFLNVLIVCWKEEGEGKPIYKLFNPSPADIVNLFKLNLVGFNNREYDNHILYARSMGYDNYQLYLLSNNLINGDGKMKFREAYNASRTDVYDFSTTKQSLKKWEIQLKINHIENEYPWDQPLPEDKWEEVAQYCANDVLATEAVFHACEGDWIARQILAEAAGMGVNNTTNQLTQTLIFGNDKNPYLVYTDLSTGEHSSEGDGLEWLYPNKFEGYEYVVSEDKDSDTRTVLDVLNKTYLTKNNLNEIISSKSVDTIPFVVNGVNMYRGTDVSKGGLVLANPGAYIPAITLDVMSMHPSTIKALNLFGKYTERFCELLNARILIKHKEFEKAKGMLNGVLDKYLDMCKENPKIAKALAQALKIAINSVYGLTSASFPNRCRDPRNVNNIVALRGALFMKTLYDEVTARGYTVIHVKTDSIKIANPDKDILDFCFEFGKKYGYNFEIEHKFDRICLVNHAVYIAKLAEDDPEEPGAWTATGTQFQEPIVFKTLFSKEPIIFDDYCQTKSVKSSMSLDFNEGNEDEHVYRFVGRVGSFVPVIPGVGGGLLMRSTNDGKYAAVTGTKGYRWMEAELVRDHPEWIDKSYFQKLIDDAVDAIEEYMPFNDFVTGELPFVA